MYRATDWLCWAVSLGYLDAWMDDGILTRLQSACLFSQKILNLASMKYELTGTRLTKIHIQSINTDSKRMKLGLFHEMSATAISSPAVATLYVFPAPSPQLLPVLRVLPPVGIKNSTDSNSAVKISRNIWKSGKILDPVTFCSLWVVQLEQHFCSNWKRELENLTLWIRLFFGMQHDSSSSPNDFGRR